MTSPQGLDDLFWGRDCEDVTDWTERLTMAAEVRDLTPDKLFKIAKLNLRGRAKEWFWRLQPAPADWAGLRTLMIQKYGNIDADDIRMKLDAIKQEPRERAQKYFERQDKLFRKGQIQDVEQRRRFLARLRPKIRKLCIVRTFADIEELVGAAVEVEGVLVELGETLYEPLREEQEENASESNVEKQDLDTPRRSVGRNLRTGNQHQGRQISWRVPRRRTPVEVTPGGIAPILEAEREGAGISRETPVKSKILSHFIKGKVSLSPMETVLMIPSELEHLENLVKLARRKRDSETTKNQASVASASPSIRKICVSKTHCSKTLHLPIEISDCIIEGLVDTGASMSVLAAAVVRELGMMHLVTGNESYKTASGVITRALGRVEEVQVKIGEVKCSMTFMVVDTDGYDVLLGLDFLMKIGAVVDVEWGLIQVRYGPDDHVEVLPLTVVNFLQTVNTGQGRNGAAISMKDGLADQEPKVGSYRDQREDEEEEDASVSDDETDNDEFHDSESNPLE
ncbi:unnamed protein product [Sphagnum balticum]